MVSKKKIFKDRIDAIDIMRGISMFLMILVHMDVYWLREESMWLVAFTFISLNFMGTSQFVFISGLGMTYSWRKSQEILDSPRLNLKRSMSRTYIMLVVAFIYNVIAILVRPDVGIEGLWYWNILQCIAVCRLMGAFLLRKPIKFRLAFYFIFLVVHSITLHWMEPRLANSILADVIFYIFYNPLAGDIFLIFFSFFLMGSIMGDVVYDCNKYLHAESFREDNGEKLKKTLRIWFITGFAFLSLGIIVGLESTTMDHWELIPNMNLHPSVNFQTIPLFLSVNSYSWALCCTGVHLIVLFTLFYFLDIKRKSIRPWYLFKMYGLYSLTIYFVHYIFLILPFAISADFSLNHVNIWPVKLILYILILGLVYNIHKKTRGRKSFEYFIKKYSSDIFKWIQEKDKKKKKGEGGIN